jgi:N-acetylglucosaminyl-diphospho-decaprenol L-rhamnosyltransferase
MNQLKFVSVLIVNYNTGNYAEACIKSLLNQSNIKIEIIIVDNASVDDSVNVLKNAFGKKITLIESKENLGFGRANNLAAGEAKGEFVLILNPDTEIQDQLAISKMVDFLNVDNRLGMVGPKIHEPRKNKFVTPRFSYPSSKKLKFKKKFETLPGKIAWLLGACLLLKREVYQEISGFDPDYFLYGEDADIGLRVRQHGYEIGYCEAATIIHVAGASEFGADSLDKWLRKKRGIFLFCRKHYDRKDVLYIAKKSIVKSMLYLTALLVTSIFHNKNTIAFVDKKHRLQATIIAAKEVINQLEPPSN